MKNPITPLVPVVLLAMTSLAGATTYYCDPVTGSMSNAGTSAKPWSTLAAVFAANKVFVAGDVILCRTGYHGAPTITKANTGDVTIQPDTGALPTLKNITFNTAASHWILNGFDICPENAGAGTYLPNTTLVYLQGPSNFITIENCHIRAVKDITGYTQDNWNSNIASGTALFVRGPNCTITNNLLENIGFGISVDKPATFTYVGYNTTINFSGDGSRGLGDDCVWEYNTIKNSYISDANHDDFFQSWSLGTDGVVGDGTVNRVTLRGNVFISQMDPNQPLPHPAMGIGCYDGMFNGWVIENNVISSNTYHGISLYGAVNCKIINNTVIENAVDGNPTIKPWIQIFPHKPNADGSAWAVPCSGNEIRNNIASNGCGLSSAIPAGTGGVADHNVGNVNTAALYASYFADYAHFNFQLLSTSPAVGAGSTLDAPRLDALGNLRNAPFDLGGYEYIPPTYQAWTSMQKLSGNAALPGTVFSPDTLKNLYKYAFGLDPRVTYQPGDPFLPYVQIAPVGGVNYLTMNFAGGATDITYNVQSTSDLTAGWTTVKSYTGSPPPGILAVPDSQPVSSSGQRFMRLQITQP